MTTQQKEFYDGLFMLKALADREARGPLTEKDLQQRTRLYKRLFEQVVCFGMSEFKKRCQKYRISNDAYIEIMQSLFVIFLEKLPKYDPRRSTPTTYFVRYFDQVISDYIHQNSQHLSQYDAHNIALVRKAKHYYEIRGVKWDEEMLSTATGLSPKVVHRTLQLEANSIYASVDDALSLQSNEPTPEDAYIKNERHEAIFGAVSDTLTEGEYKFFMYKLNDCEDTPRTYQQAADHFGISPRDAKKYFNSIAAKLSNNQILQSYRSGRSHGEATVTIHRTPDEIEADSILDALSDPGISFAPEDGNTAESA